MVNGHIPLSQEKQDVELNEATETVFLNGPCLSVSRTGPEALPAAPSSSSCLSWTWSLIEGAGRDVVHWYRALNPQERSQVMLLSTQPGFQ